MTRNTKRHLRHFREFMIVMLIVTASLVAMIGGINALSAASCRAQATALEVNEMDYGFMSGCKFQVNGTWIDSKNYVGVVLP